MPQTQETQLPILYSFRRCPYAMRARLACKYSGLKIELREIVLRNKPASMLQISPKGTVPVLQLADRIIDESWDVVNWATQFNDPDNWRGDANRINAANELIRINDSSFKNHLDHYKYADRFPEFSAEHYRDQAGVFLQQLEERLTKHQYLLDGTISLADIGVFPFIRQFAHVDLEWFQQTPYNNLQRWMNDFLESELFLNIMQKHMPWEPEHSPIYL